MQFKIEKTLFQYKNNTIIVNGQIIDCSSKVIQALITLLQSNNDVISKDKLMIAIWGDLIVSDDSLFKVVQGVRKILKQAHLEGSLINVYGKGYKIKPQIIETEETTLLRPVEKIQRKTLLLVIVGLVLITTMIFFAFNINETTRKIDSITYEKYKEMGKTQAPELLKILDENYIKQDLHIEDKIQIAYLFGYAYYKQGDYQNSIQKLQNAIELSNGIQAITATGDAYLMLAQIYVYKNKLDEMKQYLDHAERIYKQQSNIQGLSSVEISRGRYYFAKDEFDKSLEVYENLMITALASNDIGTQISILYNTSYIHELQGNINKSEQQLNHMLELALAIGKGEHISGAYSSLVSINMLQGNYTDAMKNAHLTIRYAIDQNDTNSFQQSFSSLYSILNVLGHDQLAEKYLQIAIDFQNSRNSDGHLNAAELQLGMIKLQSQMYPQAQKIFETILSYSTSEVIILEATAWLALSRYYQQDNIGAYSLSQEVYNNKSANGKTKLMAGICLVLSEYELERYTELQRIFDEISTINKDKLLIEKTYFLNMALYIFAGKSNDQYIKYQKEKDDFDIYLAKIKLDTKPEKSFLLALDKYIELVFKP